jgi:hypothetical protein
MGRKEHRSHLSQGGLKKEIKFKYKYRMIRIVFKIWTMLVNSLRFPVQHCRGSGFGSGDPHNFVGPRPGSASRAWIRIGINGKIYEKVYEQYFFPKKFQYADQNTQNYDMFDTHEKDKTL